MTANPHPLDAAARDKTEQLPPADFDTKLLEEYNANVLKSAEANHIWLNAFACINPSDDLLMSIGREVLRMLDSRECTHVSRCGQMLNLPSQREVVIRVNKS